MKTLILYATKHGAAEEIAGRIAKRLTGSTVCNLKSGNIPPVSQFDCIIIGSSLYAGSIRNEAKAFLSQDIDSLLTKRLGLFLSGMGGGEGESVFESNFPPDILKAAAAKSFIGGVFDPKKSNLFERLIMKAVIKESSYKSTISDEKIKQFTEALM